MYRLYNNEHSRTYLSIATCASTCRVAREGLLFASQQLKRAGLEDITIFERQDTWGGKTRTYSYDAPGSPGQEKVAVEMGTCYLGNT